MKKNRNYSLMVFYNSQYRILVQDRSDISKQGEAYGFFGGGLEEDESFINALIREIKEELNIPLIIEEIEKIGSIIIKATHLGLSETALFIAPWKVEYNDIINVQEGKSGGWLTLDELRSKQILPHDYLLIHMIKNYFDNQKGLSNTMVP